MKISVDLRRGVIVPFNNNCQWGSAAFEPLHGRFTGKPKSSRKFFFSASDFPSVLITYTLQCRLKWGRALSSNPLGILLPEMACCPTHAIICEMLINEPVEKKKKQSSRYIPWVCMPFKWKLPNGNLLWFYIYHALRSVSNFWVCGWNPSVNLPFN